MEEIKVGSKVIDRYVTACLYGLSHNNGIRIVGRGNNVKRSIDVAAILLRKYIDIPESLPTINDISKAIKNGDNELALDMLKRLKICEVIIDSDKYIPEDNQSNERYVSTIDIVIRGKRKE